MKNIIILLMLFLFTHCINKTSVDTSVIDESILINNFRFGEINLIDSLLFKNSQIVYLETNDKSLLRSISRIYRDERHIFIFDKSLNKVCIFDCQGKFLSYIQNIGQGAEEYISLMDFYIDKTKNEIVLLCDKPYKIMRFCFDGTFINEQKQQDFFYNIIIDSNYMYCNKTELVKTKQDEYEIVSVNTSNNQEYNSLKKRDRVLNTQFHQGNYLTKTKNVYYTRRFDNGIYLLNDGKTYKKYCIDFGKYAVPNRLMQEDDTKKFQQKCSDNKYIYSITDFFENDNYLMFNTNQGICVFDKEAQTFIMYQAIFNTEIGLGTNSFMTIGEDNTVISILEPAMLHIFKEQFAKNEKFLSLIQKVDADSNPVLFFYEFKEKK